MKPTALQLGYKLCFRCLNTKVMADFDKRACGNPVSACKPCARADARKRQHLRPRKSRAKPPELFVQRAPKQEEQAKPISPLRQMALDLGNRPQGFTAAELSAYANVKYNTVRKLVMRMMAKGLVFNLPGRLKSFRKFSTPELAAAYIAPPKAKQIRASRAKPAELKKKPGPKVGKLKKPKTPKPITLRKSSPAPRASAFASAVPIYPPGLKVQVISHGRDNRYSVTMQLGGGAITQDWLARRAA